MNSHVTHNDPFLPCAFSQTNHSPQPQNLKSIPNRMPSIRCLCLEVCSTPTSCYKMEMLFLCNSSSRKTAWFTVEPKCAVGGKNNWVGLIVGGEREGAMNTSLPRHAVSVAVVPSILTTLRTRSWKHSHHISVSSSQPVLEFRNSSSRFTHMIFYSHIFPLYQAFCHSIVLCT